MTAPVTAADLVALYGLAPFPAFEPLPPAENALHDWFSAASGAPVAEVRAEIARRAREAEEDGRALHAHRPELFDALPFADGERVLVLGDSLSAAAGGWVDILGAALRAAGRRIDLCNRAVSGRTTVETIGSLSAIAALDPDAVLLMLGTNDVRRHGASADVRLTGPGEPLALRRRLLRALDAETRARVVAITPTPIDPSVAERNRRTGVWWTEADLDELVAAILQTSLDAIDVHGAIRAQGASAGSGFWQQDGVHPTRAGQQRVAEIVLEGLAGRATSTPALR
ncbi:hypothetical protein MICRO8M_150008 [Microbacterium sp. 8M]|uniref:SGNH/GDSL hydrolase family protein n=1 Tax=Microbacterium sp. 8M TaxID=2653153 RepID=UPI0012F1C202|nr:GDSL-type esterase/lipase family protein [Microbacterium sp. 8M]VXB51061.1 hypothetical protein MICRO8M_150008 [Microbacterium sp. 8M]